MQMTRTGWSQLKHPEAQKLAETTIQYSKIWFLKNRLSMNPEKTKAVLFKTTHAGFVTPEQLNIGPSEVSFDKSTLFLAMYIDEKLRWDRHIAKLESRVSST
ncbi:hypothetical protein HHI36_013776 [Cryptolaemus montrouzieri]|uniref:Uncharacterized protein n=1 Tax=Cryptolaemus montrouzieri TaxID=559131 RepID=A0ABD2NIR7_9CUCU